MKIRLRTYAKAFVLALILTGLVGAVASVPGWSAVGVLLAPGMLAAAILFQEGIHSSWPETYLVLAALMNAFILAWPLLWLRSLIDRIRKRD